MPESRERLQRRRNRRQAVRVASRATARAVAETTPSQQTQLRQSGFTTRPVLSASLSPSFTAISTNPITFGLTAQGRLRTGTGIGIRTTARHEVAHLLGAGHQAIRATNAGRSALGLRQAPSAQRAGQGRRLAMVARSRARVNAHPQGFQTTQLSEVARTGTSTQQGRSRELMRRLGRRLRGRIDF